MSGCNCYDVHNTFCTPLMFALCYDCHVCCVSMFSYRHFSISTPNCTLHLAINHMTTELEINAESLTHDFQ